MLRLASISRRSLSGGLLLIIAIVAAPTAVRAQSPELSMRELASGQIKKGVRSIGFGGDGATWGNYGLVYRDAGTALADVGITDYTNGNDFTFTAVGATTPPLWHGLAVYVIALSQHAEDIRLSLSSPGLGAGPRPMVGLHPNVGIEQAVIVNALFLRAGIDETSYGGGITLRKRPLQLDVAYVYGLGRARVGTLFGTTSNSVLATLTFDMTWRPAPPPSAIGGPPAVPRPN